MPTLLLRLAAPLQSWGSESKFDIRQTGREPTKSGVIGMLAAALGMKRDADLGVFNKLRFGVRVEQAGTLLHDFHMAHAEKSSYLTHRYYLSDAVFLAGLECDDPLFLNTLSQALQSPEFPLYLGRRSCPPTLPLVLGIREDGLVNALKNEKPLVGNAGQALRIQYDSAKTDPRSKKQDAPISFDCAYRRYGYRTVKEEVIMPVTSEAYTEHDPMPEL